jgi:hypothetical protein
MYIKRHNSILRWLLKAKWVNNLLMKYYSVLLITTSISAGGVVLQNPLRLSNYLVQNDRQFNWTDAEGSRKACSEFNDNGPGNWSVPMRGYFGVAEHQINQFGRYFILRFRGEASRHLSMQIAHNGMRQNRLRKLRNKVTLKASSLCQNTCLSTTPKALHCGQEYLLAS